MEMFMGYWLCRVQVEVHISEKQHLDSSNKNIRSAVTINSMVSYDWLIAVAAATDISTARCTLQHAAHLITECLTYNKCTETASNIVIMSVCLNQMRVP